MEFPVRPAGEEGRWRGDIDIIRPIERAGPECIGGGEGDGIVAGGGICASGILKCGVGSQVTEVPLPECG